MDGRRALHVPYKYLSFCVFGTQCNAENFCQVFTFDDLTSYEIGKITRKFTFISLPCHILRLVSKNLDISCMANCINMMCRPLHKRLLHL